MSYIQPPPPALDAAAQAAFDKLRRIGAERLDRRQVLEAGGARYLVSATCPLRLELHVLTLHHVRDDALFGAARSLAVLEVRERSRQPHDAPDAWGLLSRALQAGATFQHEGIPSGCPVYHVVPIVQTPARLAALRGPLAKYLERPHDE